VTGLWEFCAFRVSRHENTYALQPDNFSDFRPVIFGTTMNVASNMIFDPTALPLVSFRMETSSGHQVLSRLVHGYNMHDCMILKHYDVELLSNALETRNSQTWKLISQTGDVSIWVTTILNSDHLTPTSKDVRSMPFPRVSTLDDLGWNMSGIDRQFLSNPVDNTRKMMIRKWSDSRGDPVVFLKLKPPPFGHSELLTYHTSMLANQGEDLEPLIKEAESIHAAFLTELKRFEKSIPSQ
jgi:hypothetical protein